MLRFIRGGGAIVMCEIFACIYRHCNVNPLFLVIPLQFDATIEVPSPTFYNFIGLSVQGGKDVFKMFGTNIQTPLRE